jgi:hypothetical protein
MWVPVIIAISMTMMAAATMVTNAVITMEQDNVESCCKPAFIRKS